MLVKNQKVEVTWLNTNKKWFESFGYTDYEKDKKFFVYPYELKPSSSIRVNVICDYCNEIYNTEYGVYNKAHKKYPKDCCSKCTGKKVSEITFCKRKDKYWKQLEDFCKEKDYELITNKDEYTNIKMKITYSCKKHGIKHGIMESMIHGHGCIDCKNENMVYIMQFDNEYIEQYINSFNGNKLLNKEEYINVFEHNLNIRCKCGRIYTTSFNNYKKADVRQCRKCSRLQSKNESYINSILKNMGIDFIVEKRFNDCKDIKPLPFDFYLPAYNLVIEYDGEGHYMESFYKPYCDNPEVALENRKRKDSIKNKYCKTHGIDILRIPYWEKDNIESIIKNKINLLNEIRKVS